MRRTPFAGNIIVSNLPENFTGGELASLFDDYGLVLGAVINRPTREAGGALRGMVNLAPPKAVEVAIGSLDGKVIDAHHLRVRRAPEPPPRKKATKVPRRPVVRKEMPREIAESWFAAPAAARPARTVIVERRPLARSRLLGAKPASEG